MDRDRLTPAEVRERMREREMEDARRTARIASDFNKKMKKIVDAEPGRPVPKDTETAKEAFLHFLKVAGFKCANLSAHLGGADLDTPADRIYVMLIGVEGTEFRLGGRSEPFVFDPQGNLFQAGKEAKICDSENFESFRRKEEASRVYHRADSCHKEGCDHVEPDASSVEQDRLATSPQYETFKRKKR